jgi:hypothetical protein
MKARHSFIYLLLLGAIAGYFYYFEVIKPQQKKEAERVAKKLFHFAVDQVDGLEILPRGGKAVRLNKDTRWHITEPITSDVDEAALNGVVSTLESLQPERQVVESSEDLKAFGLQDPALAVRFKVGEGWRELLVGDKNPVGDAYFAKTAERPAVFLLAQGNWTVLSKSANDLRRRQLLAFEPLTVTGLEVTWRDGSRLVVYKDSGGVWKSPDQPEMVIKKSKVDNVLDQIQWLRARDFLTDEVTGLAEHGLAPAEVTVKLHLKDNREEILQLGKQDTAKKRVVALSSELSAVVQVDDSLLQELPKQLRGLEDRSLLDIHTAQVKQVIWSLGQNQGHAVQTGDNQWSLKADSGKGEALKEPWRIRSLLWELGEAAYERRLQDNPAFPRQPQGTLEFWDAKEKLGSLAWEKPPQEDAPLTSLWKATGSDQKIQALQVKTELIRKLEDKVKDLAREPDK